MDLLIAGWVLTVSLLLFCWWPYRIFAVNDPHSSTAQQLARYSARLLFITVVAVIVLSQLRLLNFLTLSLVYLGYPIIKSLRKLRREQQTIRSIVTGKLLEYADLLESGLLRIAVTRYLQQHHRHLKTNLSALISRFDITRAENFAVTIMIGLITGLTIWWRLALPLQQLRLARTESYQLLLQARQLLNGEPIWPSQLAIMPIITGVVSIFSAIDVMQVQRFFGPFIGILMVGCLGWVVFNLTNSRAAALLAGFQLGAYTFGWPGATTQLSNNSLTLSASDKFLNALKLQLIDARVYQWAIGEAEVGALLILLALICCYDLKQLDRSRFIDLIGILILAAVISPGFALIALLIIIGLLLRLSGNLLLMLVAIAWIGLALWPILPAQLLPQLTRFTEIGQAAFATLPIALSLLLGALMALFSQLIKWLCKPVWAQYAVSIILIGYLISSVLWLWPAQPTVQFLEYDIAARKTLEIAQRFPRKRWLIIAPVEQLAETYGLGWYQDIAQFIEQQSQLSSSDLALASDYQQIFIFVEKRPFNIFASEPIVLPFSILNDPTYRYYRSPAGRASLQFNARQFCESYRRNHPDTKIYYDDDLLTIYQFSGNVIKN